MNTSSIDQASLHQVTKISSSFSNSDANSIDAVHIRKIKKGYRFPPAPLGLWRAKQRQRREGRRRARKTVEYSWMNIEGQAACKVQALYRRMIARRQLERCGMTTSSMRNAIRERKVIDMPWRVITDDVPFLLRCCGISLLFGGPPEEERDEWRRDKRSIAGV